MTFTSARLVNTKTQMTAVRGRTRLAGSEMWSTAAAADRSADGKDRALATFITNFTVSVIQAGAAPSVTRVSLLDIV